ncbi:hypothetical protein [Austwickia chelonae]|uniref:hypothetical protein n=1 Tax=Austwickia chelonae TaxID=100225 RepID=UPI000E264C21|nr:hypothetical protein [Austwickia chelonae]
MPAMEAGPSSVRRTEDICRDAAEKDTALGGETDAAKSTAVANWRSVLTEDRVGRARKIFGSDLDYLTDTDRQLIHAVTGEVIWQGQEPHERPLSAFAMQIAVDRRTRALAEGEEISQSYLQRTCDRLAALGVPANPFQGVNLRKAKDYLASRSEVPRSG